MTAIALHLSAAELEARYEIAADPVSKSHFHAIWLLSLGYAATEVAAILSFSARWIRQLVKRYNEQGPDSLADLRQGNGAAPAILTPEALSSLKQRLKTPHYPSPQPSPNGRGSPLAAVEKAFPLPLGEGQGEG